MIVLVHGVPETERVWDAMRAELPAESVALSLPGFGGPRPVGFSATKDEYAEWLIGELESLGGPVDLVGHDWGAPLSYRVATTRPDLVRAWCCDLANGIHPDYVWHDFARTWQTPGDGEAFFSAQATTPRADLAAVYESLGVASGYAPVMAEAMDETMASCILDLYRSATPNIHADWGPWGPTAMPGLVIVASEDAFGDERLSRETASALGADVAVLEGLGHWWMTQDPARGARVVTDFLARATR